MMPSTPGSSPARRRIVLLGSTGSIGGSTLAVAENLSDRYEVVGLAAGRNAPQLARQARRFGVRHLAIAEEAGAAPLKRQVPGARVWAGPHAAEALVEATEAELLVAAIVGAAGLRGTLAGIQSGMDIALANKETLVAAGELVMPMVRERGVELLPIDSEHSAIFQCIQPSARRSGADRGPAPSANGRAVERIVLTASGGPFRTATLEQIRNATVEEALNHPTWRMGRKITVDSATMMNKALEIIEAHWLFDLPASRIEVIIHPQSIAHSFVEFTDRSVLAQLGPPDMKTPIQYALTWPDRTPGCGAAMNWSQLRRLDFEPPDPQRFPALPLAYEVIERGGTAGAVVNAANEEAVEAFLAGRIPFGRIVELNREALHAVALQPVRDLQTVLEADAAARRFVRGRLDR